MKPDPTSDVNFARSGKPNEHTVGNGAEEETGTITSSPYIVSYSTLEWLSIGWSGGDPDNPIINDPVGGTTISNKFQILNSSFAVLSTIAAAQTDGALQSNGDLLWETASVNLLAIGLSAGDTFYFRAVDGRSDSSYAWIGFDNLTLTGTELELPVGVVPEATSFLIWGLLGVTFAVGGWKRRERE